MTGPDFLTLLESNPNYWLSRWAFRKEIAEEDTRAGRLDNMELNDMAIAEYRGRASENV